MWRDDVNRGATGGAAGVVAVSALDLVALALHDGVTLDSGWGAVVVACVSLGALVGLGLGALWSVAARTREPLVAILAGAMALGALLADIFVLPRLYPLLHLGLAAVAVLSAAVAGANAWPPSGARAGFPVAGVAAALGLWVWFAPDALLGQGASRQAVMDRTRLARHVVSQVQTSVAPEECAWPSPPTAGAEPGTPPARPRASILLLTVDALRADHGGAALAQFMPKTAARLAGAWVFDRVYAAAPRTNESVYSLFTGRPAPMLAFAQVGVDAEDRFVPVAAGEGSWKRRHPAPLGDTTPTLAETLGRAGWDTFAAIGYVYLLPAAGITRGFERTDDTAYQRHNRDNAGLTSDALADALIKGFATHDRARPLFAWAHFMDPHAPYRPYEPAGVSPDETDALTLYRGELRRVDDALDRVLGDPALPEDTLVVLTSDHGEEFGEHGGAYHGTTLFDEQIRVPAWVWSRDGGLAPAPGAPVSATLATYDLMPTLLDLVGVAAPSGMIGRSWAPALIGRGALPEAPVLMTSTLHRTLFGAAAGLDKLVFEPAAGVAAYYDLAQDPEERANRIDAAPERVAPLACQLSTVARKP